MTKENNPEKKQINIQVDIDDITAQGTYSNLAITNYSQEEFLLDFVFIQPHVKKGKIRNRVILSPRNAKKLAHMLMNNIEKYENNFGFIPEEPGKPSNGIELSIN
jgi:hypothetical protein